MPNRRERERKVTNRIPKKFLECKLPYTAVSLFQTPQDDFEDTDYYVQILKCIPKVGADTTSNEASFILKSTNDKDKIYDEFGFISHMKESLKRPSRYIKETTLINVGDKVGLRMPVLLKFRELRDMAHFPGCAPKYTRQLIDQLAQMHIGDIFHGDIKGDNFMYDPITDTLCIIDFGESQRIEGTTKPKYKDLDKWDHKRSMKDNGAHFQCALYRPPECFHDEDKGEFDVWESKMVELEEKYTKSKNNKFRNKLKKLRDSTPDCYDMLNEFTTEELNNAEYTFCYHNTLYSDIYAMGICLLEYMSEYLNEDQIAFLKVMRSCELLDRPPSYKLTWDNLNVFDTSG